MTLLPVPARARGLLCAVALAATAIAFAAGERAHAANACREEPVADTSAIVCAFDLAAVDMRLFLNDEYGAPYGSFRALRRNLQNQGYALPFAMNAGMYHRDRSPVGLYVENGKTLKEAVNGPGPGNFHMRPNGIFYITGGRAGVVESRRFTKRGIKADYATQSGPMLLIDGELHPRFIPGSEFRKVRNGVCVRDGTRVIFAITRGVINFHDFATLFKERFGCRDALYLDGTISSIYAPDFGRTDFLYPLGPIVAVVERRPEGDQN